MNSWFDVDKEGLSKIIKRRGLSFIVFELIQNGWDEDVTQVHALLKMYPNRPLAHIKVTDNSPQGFRSLRDAYTLFAESYKKGDPTKRGRFNLGEKLVLACAENASIATTTGTVIFGANGTRTVSRKKTDNGSVFEADIKMTRAEYDEICKDIQQLIVPNGTWTYFNGVLIEPRTPVAEFNAPLITEISDEEGNLRRTIRRTQVKVYETREGETSHIYEMGIPVVEINDKFHINVDQKVPLSLDRDNVPPAFLRDLRVYVLNHTHSLLSKEDAAETWVTAATASDKVEVTAFKDVITKRFGEKVVAFDPSDKESNALAFSQGYTVVSGGTLSGDQWKNVKKFNAFSPAGQVTPVPKPFSKDGRPLKLLENETPAIKAFIRYVERISKELIGVNVMVRMVNDSGWAFSGCYGDGTLTVNVAKLGYDFFNDLERITVFAIHELSHEYDKNHPYTHLSDQYNKETCRLGAKLVKLALEEPELFKLD